MKKITLVFFITIALFSCKKNTDDEVNPEIKVPKSYANKIVLNNPVVTGDSVKLTWSMLDTANFLSYALLRKDYANGSMTLVKEFNNKNNVIATDELPYSPSVQYQVSGYLTSGKIITSNTITYSRPEIKAISISPFDVIFNDTDKLLYFFEKNGKITIYNTNDNVITKSITTNATIGYSDFGIYKGKKELYVPRSDGWVFVYDAYTLEKITMVSTGLSNSCVVFNNNNLYVSTSAWTNRPIKVHNRETSNRIAETGDFDLTRFKHIPNSNFKLLEITLNIGPVDQHLYNFTPDGKLISHTNDRYHGDYPLDAGIFEFFPDGSKYITHANGAIYNQDMNYLASLPRGNLLFTTFAINQNEKLIYAGCTKKQITVYTLDGYNEVKTIRTKAYPYRLFDLGNKILCISSISPILGYSPNVDSIVFEIINK